MRVFGSRARRLVAVGLGVGVFVCFSSPGGRQQTVPTAIVASGRKALGNKRALGGLAACKTLASKRAQKDGGVSRESAFQMGGLTGRAGDESVRQ